MWRIETVSSMKISRSLERIMTLHYATNRTVGYKSVVTIPVSGASVPSSLSKYHCKNGSSRQDLSRPRFLPYQ